MKDSSKEEMSIEEKRYFFIQELEEIRKKKLISDKEYIRISDAYDRHVLEAIQRREEEVRLREEQEHSLQPDFRLDQNLIKTDTFEWPAELKIQKETASAKGKKKVAMKLEKTSEQLRERNISIVLITGVIFLLFGGLIWATSTWGILNVILKVVCISLVSIFFSINAWIAFKLKIKQTAFAFLTLASLFLPIAILSAAYYQIFGEYLSFQGEGRGLLGFIGGLICLLIYIKIANYFQSKLFIFISCVTFALTILFGMAYLTFTNEALFLIMSVFNLFFLLNLEKIKNNQKLLIFKPYALQFLAFKIMVETFVVLTLFVSNVIYSITLIITSMLFFIFAFRYKKTYLHVIFSIVFTYGYIHFVFHSFLDEIKVTAFAFLPFVFLGLYKYLKKADETLSKNFLYTSLISSSFVFIYIYAMFFSEPETHRFLALLILSAQFGYLSFEQKGKFYTYPTLILFNLSIYDLGSSFQLSVFSLFHLLFVVQVCLYLGLYVFNHHPKWGLFRNSTLAITSTIMAAITFLRYEEAKWLDLSLGLAVISGLFFITYYKERSKQPETVSTYGFPICIALSLLALYPSFYERNIEVSVHLIFVSMLMIGLGLVWKNREVKFFHIFFITGQCMSLLSFLSIMDDSLPPFVVTAMILIIIGINGWSVYLFHKHWLWLPVIITSIGLYVSLFDVFHFYSAVSNTAFYLMGSLVFYWAGEWIGKHSLNGGRYFFWYSQLMNMVAIPTGFMLIAFQNLNPWLYVIVLLLYVISALRARITWQRFCFTYIGLVVLYLQVLLFYFHELFVIYTASLSLFITAGIIIVLWVIANKEWKNILDYYLISFLNLAAFVHIFEVFLYGFSSKFEMAWVGYETLLLGFSWYLLLRRKWKQIVAFPLMLIWIYFTMYSEVLPVLLAVLIFFGWMAVMLVFSKWKYQGLIKKNESGIEMDYYRIFGFFFLLVMNRRVLENEIEMMALDIIVSCFVVVYFLVIRNWTVNPKERKIYLAVAVTFGLYPYQILLENIKVPDILITEVYIIPLFFIGPFLLRKIINRGTITQMIEILFVSFLFMILLMDALEGNTLNDALIIGTISLVSVMIGFLFKYKSFFLAGLGTILLNVYWNTHSLWGQMPWWFYLIIGGILLIATASFIEWKKQKENKTSKEILDRNKERVKSWFSKWN